MTPSRGARVSVAVGLAVLGVALAGCGSSESEQDAAGTTTTQDSSARQKFLAEGDAICAEGQVEAAELARRAQEIQARTDTLSDSEVYELAADIWVDQIRLIERFRDRLSAMDPPPGDEARVATFVATLDEGLALSRQIQAKMAEGDSPGELVQSYGRVVARGNTLAQAYGFQVCGRTG